MPPLIFVLCFGSGSGMPQITSNRCTSHFLFLKDFTEKNCSSFADNVLKKRRAAYKKICDSLQRQLLACDACCFSALKTYLSFFLNTHLGLTGEIDESDSSAVKYFLHSPYYLNTKKIILDSAQLKNLREKSLLSIEGIYGEKKDGRNQMAVIRTGENKYSGITLKSTTPFWAKWQVRFELYLKNDTTFDCKFYYNLLRESANMEVKFTSCSLTRLNYQKTGCPKNNTMGKLAEFRMLDDSTCYLKISSLDGSYYKELDTFYKEKMEVMKSTPYLVVDIRNNSGGSTECYKALKPLFYTNPVKGDVGKILCTPANIRLYKTCLEKMEKDAPAFGAEGIAEMKRIISIMEKTRPYQFAVVEVKQEYHQNGVLPYPKKIALLFNKRSAGSAEDLIFFAMQSKKVITIGGNSRGATGYGNVFKIPIPDSIFVLFNTTMVNEIQKKYEEVGIEPMYKISPDEDAVKKAVEWLKK